MKSGPRLSFKAAPPRQLLRAAWAMTLVALATIAFVYWGMSPGAGRSIAGASAFVVLFLGVTAGRVLERGAWREITLADGAWSVQGEPAVLASHALMGPFVFLHFRLQGARIPVTLGPGSAGDDVLRRLRMHLRTVHRPEAAVR